jgi:hypothetical protein
MSGLFSSSSACIIEMASIKSRLLFEKNQRVLAMVM